MDGDDVMTGEGQGDSRTLELGFSEAGRASTDEPDEGVRVPTPAPAPTMSAEESAVLAVLAWHRGRAAAIGLDALALMSGLSERVVQEVVAQLIERHGQPIGSAVKKPMGYFVIETDAELAESLSQLVHRLTALARRIAALKRSTTPIVLQQLALDIGESPRLDAAGVGGVRRDAA